MVVLSVFIPPCRTVLLYSFQAEQIWNIATYIMKKDCADTDEQSKRRFNAAMLYGKSHDFALLSEEEYGETLTKGHLDFENFDTKPYREKMFNFTSSVNIASFDICSEFTAQCLLLKVAHVIDDVNAKQDANKNRTIENMKDDKMYLSSAMNCLVAAYTEMEVIDIDINEKIQDQVPWLALSLMIALRDDEFCSSTLSNRGLLMRLERTLHGNEDYGNENAQRATSLAKVIHFASRAECHGMNESAKNLLCLYANVEGNVSSKPISIGLVQRKIISFASRVEEVVHVFKSVYDQVRSSSSDGDSPSHMSKYEIEDIDYFVVEAHNRAVTLLHIGDYINAEKLLTIALNLIPHGGKEVACHATEIRKLYRGVIQRCSNSANGLFSVLGYPC